jgi:hypothetical protein
VTGRGLGGGPGQSPFEIVGFALVLTAVVGVGVLWSVGLVVGSILGATLPGSASEGVAAILRSFPDVGRAWEPPVSSGLVWAVAALAISGFGPLVWKLSQIGRLSEQGSQWATTADLRRAGLLVEDRPLPHAKAEEPTDAA